MLVSLGHSCQTRFIIDELDGASRRMPFDFNIATRPALLAALATDGASLQHDEGSARIFAMPSDGREGIEIDGMYFWHDYPLAEDKRSLAEGWQREIPRVNEKYSALWARLSALLRSDEPKTLVLSNSQHNLAQFAEGDSAFSERFGLGRMAFEQISGALDRFGARNYRLLFLTRTIADFAETVSIDDPRLEHRFVGTLSLRPDRRIPDSMTVASGIADMTPLLGSYDGGMWQVSAASGDRALVHKRTEDGLLPAGSLTLSGTNPIAWFEGRDKFRDFTHSDGTILFSDGERWQRD